MCCRSTKSLNTQSIHRLAIITIMGLSMSPFDSNHESNPSTFSLWTVAPETETNYSFICLQLKKGELRNDQFFQHKANLLIHERSSKGRECPRQDAARSQQTDLLYKYTHTKLCRGDFSSYKNGQSGGYRRTANPFITKMGHRDVWYVGTELLSQASE
jgi:hypothetical protein